MDHKKTVHKAGVSADEAAVEIGKGIDELVALHKAGKVKALFYVADQGDSASVCLIEAASTKMQMAARQVLKLYGQWTDPPPIDGDPRAVADYMLSRGASSLALDELSSVCVILVWRESKEVRSVTISSSDEEGEIGHALVIAEMRRLLEEEGEGETKH
jgi:hypothetical protein